MVGVVFSYDFLDDPYSKKKAVAGVNKLEELVQGMGEELFISLGDDRNELKGNFCAEDLTVVHYTCDLTSDQKAQIAKIISEILTLKKSAYKGLTMPKSAVVFNKVDKSDCYVF